MGFKFQPALKAVNLEKEEKEKKKKSLMYNKNNLQKIRNSLKITIIKFNRVSGK